MEHREIPILEEHISPLVYGGDTLERTLDFLQDVYQLIEQDELNEHDPEYEYYLTTFSDTVHKENIKQIIECTDSYPKPRRNGVRFGAFFLLVMASLEDFVDYGRLSDIDERWGDEFQDRPMYYYLRSQIHKQGYRPEHNLLATGAGYQAAKAINNNPLVFSSFAGTITSLCYTYDVGEINIDGLPSDRDELLEVANEYASKAVTLAPKDPSAYSTLSTVLALQERFEEAEEKLNEAIKWELETKDQPDTSGYKLQMDELQRDRRRVEFTEFAISRTREDIEELHEEMDNVVERYRSQTLQFLGFFAAIVAIVVTSAQIAVTAPSFADASGLILTLTGGILVAFGGLSVAIPRASSSVPWRRTIVIMIAGAVLIGLGFASPRILEFISI